jgi:hypothetical protein
LRARHGYESLRSIPALVQHQTRMVIGGAINTVVFDHLYATAPGFSASSTVLRTAAQDEPRLAGVLRSVLRVYVNAQLQMARGKGGGYW